MQLSTQKPCKRSGKLGKAAASMPLLSTPAKPDLTCRLSPISERTSEYVYNMNSDIDIDIDTDDDKITGNKGTKKKLKVSE